MAALVEGPRAALFALPVVRRPAPGIATVLGGGYPASGEAGRDRLPTPVLPASAPPRSAAGTSELIDVAVNSAATGQIIQDLDATGNAFGEILNDGNARIEAYATATGAVASESAMEPLLRALEP